jgi:hypothetical protein
MAVSHPFKATNVFLTNSGGASLSGELMVNGATPPINVHVSIDPPSSSGNRAVLFGPLSNARIAIDLAAHENTAVALRAATSVSITFESTTPVPSTLVAGHTFSDFTFRIVRKLEA